MRWFCPENKIKRLFFGARGTLCCRCGEGGGEERGRRRAPRAPVCVREFLRTDTRQRRVTPSRETTGRRRGRMVACISERRRFAFLGGESRVGLPSRAPSLAHLDGTPNLLLCHPVSVLVRTNPHPRRRVLHEVRGQALARLGWLLVLPPGAATLLVVGLTPDTHFLLIFFFFFFFCGLRSFPASQFCFPANKHKSLDG